MLRLLTVGLSCALLLCVAVAADESRSLPVVSSDRIIGGEEVTDINDYKFQVALRCLGVHYCGGAIISQFFVLTAADCITRCRLVDLTVHSGSIYLNRAAMAHEPLAIYFHPLFNSKTKDYDVGLVRVLDRDKFDEFSPITISEGDLPELWPVAALGWGITTEGSEPHSPVLKKVDLSVASWTNCFNTYNGKPGINITLNMMCTSTDEGNGPCSGDFGGPLIDTTSGTSRVVGVAIETSQFCGRAEYPNVYTKLQEEIRRWIKSIALV